MQKTVLIYDAQKARRDVLTSYVVAENNRALIHPTGDLDEAYLFAAHENIDVFIIVIDVRGSVGGRLPIIEYMDKIKSVDKYRFSPLIAISALENGNDFLVNDIHCYACFGINFNEDKLKKTIRNALLYKTKSIDGTLYRISDRIFYPMKHQEIVYVRTCNRKLHIHMSENRELTFLYNTCKQVLNDLNSDLFFQISRNSIVNRDYIYNIDYTNKYITLNTGEKLDIGGTFVSRIKERFRT